MKELCIIAAMLLASTLVAQHETEVPYRFSIRLIATPAYVDLQSEQGCSWLSLHFMVRQNGDPIFVNESGMLGSNMKQLEAYIATSQFLFTVGRTERGITITVYKGAAWDAYTEPCTNAHCALQLTQQEAFTY